MNISSHDISEGQSVILTGGNECVPNWQWHSQLAYSCHICFKTEPVSQVVNSFSNLLFRLLFVVPVYLRNQETKCSRRLETFPADCSTNPMIRASSYYKGFSIIQVCPVSGVFRIS